MDPSCPLGIGCWLETSEEGRPRNEAGIFGLWRSFTEQACSVKVAF